jgi:uncharacterized protein (DUF1778 family)
MARKKPSATNERFEMQVPPGWTDAVDKAAAAVGLSRSAYVRLAVARLMQQDKRESKDLD